MFRRAAILFGAAVMLVCAHVYADDCTKANESENICGGSCAPTCQNPNPNGHLCAHNVCRWNVTSGCRCDEDYYRDDISENCYLLKDCPK